MTMTNQRLKKLKMFANSRRCTLLGIGAMSKNCIDAVIDISKHYNIPLMLIASRGQVETEMFGGGYVTTTEQLGGYIRRYSRNSIVLCRDHGGPWQGEKKGTFHEAMKRDKASFKADIEAGFDIIHIDVSMWSEGEGLVINEVLERIYELYDYCWGIAKENGRKIDFEIGSREQNGDIGNLINNEYIISEVIKHCEKNKMSKPLFVVVQTGSKVMEMKNIGSFENIETEIPKLVSLCNKHGVFMKEHNADYLSDKTLVKHPVLGIHAANVAPEFAVTETKAFIDILKKNQLDDELKKFIGLSYESKKWKKWMLPGSRLTDFKRAIIAGHYIFSTPEFIEIKTNVENELLKKNIVLDEYLVSVIEKQMIRYLKCFNMIGRQK